MPKIRVRFFANLREHTKLKELVFEGMTVREVLDKICKKFPGLENMLFDGGNLRPYMNIFLNGRDISGPGGMETELHAGDEIAIFPPVSGG